MTQLFHSGKLPALPTPAEYHIFFQCMTLQATEYNPPNSLMGEKPTYILPYFLKGNKFHVKIVFENTIITANDPTNHTETLQPSEQWILPSSKTSIHENQTVRSLLPRTNIFCNSLSFNYSSLPGVAMDNLPSMVLLRKWLGAGQTIKLLFHMKFTHRK